MAKEKDKNKDLESIVNKMKALSKIKKIDPRLAERLMGKKANPIEPKKSTPETSQPLPQKRAQLKDPTPAIVARAKRYLDEDHQKLLDAIVSLKGPTEKLTANDMREKGVSLPLRSEQLWELHKIIKSGLAFINKELVTYRAAMRLARKIKHFAKRHSI